jgi:hypothetical protein
MRDGECCKSKVSVDGLISGYKIAGNMAREKALDIVDYQCYRTSETWHYWTDPLPAGEFFHVECLATVIKL